MQHRGMETHRQILAASWDLFSQRGYDATGVADICAAANVSKGAFYHHFSSKQDVFLALVHDWLSGLEKNMQSAWLAASNVPEALMKMAEMSEEVFHASRGKYIIFLEFWVQALRQPAVWEAVISPYHYYHEWLTSIIREGIKEGSLSQQLDPSTTARIIIALAMGLLLQAFFDPDGANWDRVTQDGVRLLMQGMIRKKE